MPRPKRSVTMQQWVDRVYKAGCDATLSWRSGALQNSALAAGRRPHPWLGKTQAREACPPKRREPAVRSAYTQQYGREMQVPFHRRGWLPLIPIPPGWDSPALEEPRPTLSNPRPFPPSNRQPQSPARIGSTQRHVRFAQEEGIRSTKSQDFGYGQVQRVVGIHIGLLF